MSLKNTPSSENPEENKFPEKIKEDNARNKTFQEIAKLEDVRNTKEKTNHDLSKLQSDRLKEQITAQKNIDISKIGDIYTVSENENPTSNSQNTSYTIAPSNMTIAQENSLKGSATAVMSVGKSCINACISLGKGVYNTPRDLRGLLNKTATYDGIV